MILWFQVFLYNTNNSYTIIWFQVFLSNTYNSYIIIYFQTNINIFIVIKPRSNLTQRDYNYYGHINELNRYFGELLVLNEST